MVLDKTYYTKDLKKGMIVYDCWLGCNMRLRILNDAKETAAGWQATAVKDNGTAILLSTAHAAEKTAYKTVYYSEPQYVDTTKGD